MCAGIRVSFRQRWGVTYDEDQVAITHVCSGANRATDVCVSGLKVC